MEERTIVKMRMRSWWRENSFAMALAILGILLLVGYIANDIFIRIFPGEAGVQWSLLRGGTKKVVYGEGVHAIFPWNIMYKYDVRFQQRSAKFDVLSSDGLSISTVITVRFKPVVENLALLHKYVGRKYVETLLLPEVGAHARELIAQHAPEDLYSEARYTIQQKIRDRLVNETRIHIGPQAAHLTDFLYVEDVFLESITLPEDVARAIRNKLTQYQHLQEYEYIVQREKREAERKEIEARGIRAFQDIVNEGISDKYLRWKGIDATLKLAQSPNSKIVVIGSGESGLPIILGNVDSGPEPPAARRQRPEPPRRTTPTLPARPATPANGTPLNR